ncbi:MAG TPA: DUF433 domain-containing protein [Longimicrobium sp.]|jgi:uncharacterized protein (DUF433 family)
MNWREYIHSDPAVLAGKPVVRGTRLAVNFLIRLLASGWTREQVLYRYPQLSDEALRAIVAFAEDAPGELTAQEGEHAPRRFGSARGQIRMAEDFDAPLDDFKEYM